MLQPECNKPYLHRPVTNFVYSSSQMTTLVKGAQRRSCRIQSHFLVRSVCGTQPPDDGADDSIERHIPVSQQVLL